MTRPGWLVHAEHDAMNDWDGTRWDDDGRDEPKPEPAPSVPDEFRQRCMEVEAAMREQQKRRRWVW